MNINEIPTEKLSIYAGFGGFAVFMILVTSCTVHMNTYNAGEAKIVAARANAEAELVRQQHTANLEQLKAVERLISEENVNPLAARCAIFGRENGSSVCDTLAKNPVLQIEEAK